jgi:hypothetical protein
MAYRKQQERMPAAEPGPGCYTFEQMNIMTNSNRLWMEYAFWMRALIDSTAIGSEREEYIAGKLFDDLMQEYFLLFEFYYGTQLARTFRSLFTNFASGAWGLVRAIKSNNAEEINAQTVQLYQRADELSDFLGRINPYYNANEWKNFFYQAIELVIDEALSVINKDYAREIEISDSMADLSMLMGNYMAGGLLASHLSACGNFISCREE